MKLAVNPPVDVAAGDESPGAGETAAPAPEAAADPWTALLQVGARLVSALAATGDAAAAPYPWIERDPASGARRLRVPPPETARGIADALSAIAQSLRATVTRSGA